ncbi:MAG: FAD-dependent oxidoreductase [Marinifilaceae bacterium]|jgi:protoporphyrinogen oxidase|nr:FAD-dependent oxidoreductase [Marinifilaceae bacterium]
MEENYDYIIIGSGISGMSFAQKAANENKKILILERKNYIGGCIKTTYDKESDFWVENAAHTCYNKYIKLLKLAEDIGLTEEIIKREKKPFKIYDKEILNITKKLNFIEFIFNFPKIFFSKKTNKNVADYYSNIFGKKNYKKLFSKLFAAIISQTPDKFDVRYMLKRRKTKNNNFPRSFTFKRGLSHLITKIAEHPNITVATNQNIESISNNSDWTVSSDDGKSHTGKNLVLACNPKTTAELTKNIFPQLNEILSEIELTDINSYSFVFDQNKLNLSEMSFLISLNDDFRSIVTRDIFPHAKKRGFSCHSGSKRLDIEKLGKNLFIDKINNSLNSHILNQLPILSCDHKKRLEQIDKLESDLYDNNTILLGNYFQGLSIEDCVERSVNQYRKFNRIKV